MAGVGVAVADAVAHVAAVAVLWAVVWVPSSNRSMIFDVAPAAAADSEPIPDIAAAATHPAAANHFAAAEK